MTHSLHGKRILLTGASRGIGRAAATLLLKNGAHILGVAKTKERLERAHSELHDAGLTAFSIFTQELTAPEAGARLAEAVVEKLGGVDIVIFNAGVQYNDGGIMDEPAGMLEQSLEQNLMAPFRMARELIPLLLKADQPRLINVSSGAGTMDALREPAIASYRLSKWALNGLTLLQARQYAGRLHISAFDPGWIKTDLGGPNAPGTPEEAAEGLLKTLLLPWEESGKFYKDGQEIPW